MAYTHSKYEVMMQPIESVSTVHPTMTQAGGTNLAVTTIAARWAPGFVPHIIRGAALVQSATNAVAANPVPVRFEADISTPGTATTIFTIAMPTVGQTNNSIFYRPTYYIEIKPGAQVVVRPSTAATAGVRAHCILYVEPRWEEPGNVTGLKQTT